MKQFKKVVKSGIATVALLGASAANAALIDFESVAVGVYSSLTFGDATLTYTGGTGTFDITAGNNGTNTAISFLQNPGNDPFRLDFAGGASSVFLDVGDFGADQDSAFLELYDQFDNLLSTTLATVPAGSDVSVNFGASASNVAYALFGDEDPFAGAVYWDNIAWEPAGSTNPVPVPGTVALMGLGLLLVGAGRKAGLKKA